MGRRVLVTGINSFWGGRVAQALEDDPSVELIVGLGAEPPAVELERTEYVRADQNYSILARLVRATQVDTVLHTFLQVDSTRASGRQLHETNVIGTMNLLAAAGASDSSVRTLVVKSSTLVYGATYRDPVWFREGTSRSASPKTRVERSLLEVEDYLRDFAEDNPHIDVTVLRFANVLGAGISTPITDALRLPLVPCILGFDPLLQFAHEDDVVRSVVFVMASALPGIYNVAGDGKLPWSEVAAMCDRRLLPLPPTFTGLATGPLAKLGLVELPPELLALLRYGRGVDNRRLKAAGFGYRYTSAGAVDAFAQESRLHRAVGARDSYRYERDVENFFRHSPAVVRDP
ncbi:MAG TPA: NAD-dependent epimerase/dehydratase family protein [Acidimicrobiales bacterium]|nr:NAD-dependent epimerase/dehydratase family protein [Acidimicrobiales bacterium]